MGFFADEVSSIFNNHKENENVVKEKIVDEIMGKINKETLLKLSMYELNMIKKRVDSLS